MRTIFISSTFRDMQAERDAIHISVIPELRVMAQKYGEDIEVCDLRWGVNTGDLDSETGSKKVLSVCLDEIDRCKPFMLVILGERYGWIPEPALLVSAAKRKHYQLEELERSVTALEIEYGALDDLEVLKRTIFLFREPMPEADSDYQSEGEDYARRLDALKNRIRKMAGDRVFSYQLGWDSENKTPTHLEHFTDIVTEQLRILLEEEWKEYALLSENQKEEKRHWEFVNKKAGQFGGRTKLLAECKQRLEHGKGMIAVVGEAGSGKSTLWCKLVSDYREQGWNVYPFVCGSTSNSTSGTDMIKQWVYYVEELLQEEHFEEDEKTAESNMIQYVIGEAFHIQSDWSGRLNEVLDMYSARMDLPPLLLTADGLDSLDSDELVENYGFLPAFKKEKVYFLLSFPKKYNRSQYKGDAILIDTMTSEEKQEVLRGMLTYQQKGLDEIVTAAVMKKPGVENPLYLSLLMQRLAIMDKDDFAVIAEYGNDMQAINRYQMELILQAPETPEEMSCLLVQEVGKRVNNMALVQKAAEYIAVSRQGLRECDLQRLLEEDKIPWNALDFSRTVHYMPMLFVEKNNGRFDLAHREIRAGLREHADEWTIKHHIFSYLKTLPLEDELQISETVYYCHALDEKQYLVEYFTKCMEQYTAAKGTAACEEIVSGKRALENAARELYRICMEDAGEWYLSVMNIGTKCGRGEECVDFTWSFLNNTFENGSMQELQIALKIDRFVLDINRWIAEKLRTFKGRWEYGLAYERVGNICVKLGRLQEAQEMYEMCYLVRGTLYGEHKTPELHREYGVSCEKLGMIYEVAEKLKKALRYYEECWRIRKELLNRAMTEENMRDYSVICNKLGSVYEKQGNIKEAEEKYEESFLIRKEMYERCDTQKSERDYSVSCDKLGDIYEKQGRLEAALEKYEEGLGLSWKLYVKQKSPQSQRDYMLSCERVGKVYFEMDRLEEALEKCEEGRELSCSLYEKQKTPESLRDYSTSYFLLGTIYEKQGDKQAALCAYTEGWRLDKELCEMQQTIGNLIHFASSSQLVGDFLEARGKRSEALEKLELSCKLWKIVCEANQTRQNFRMYLETLRELGELYFALGRFEEAIQIQNIVADYEREF